MAIDTNNPNIYPEVFIYSDSRELVGNLFEKLYKKNCIATLVLDSDESKKYYSRSDLVLSIQEVKNKIKRNPGRLFYFIICIGNLDKDKLRTTLNTTSSLIELAKSNRSKALLVLPYNQISTNSKTFSTISQNAINDNSLYAGLIYTGELLEINNNSFSSFFEDGNPVLPKESNIFYPVIPSLFSDFLISSLFSMKAYRSVTGYLGNQLSSNQIEHLIINHFPQIKIKRTNDAYSRPTLTASDLEVSKTNVSEEFFKVLNFFASEASKNAVLPKQSFSKKPIFQNWLNQASSRLKLARKTIKTPGLKPSNLRIKLPQLHLLRMSQVILQKLHFLAGKKKQAKPVFRTLTAKYGFKWRIVALSLFVLVITLPLLSVLFAQTNLYLSQQLTNRGYISEGDRLLPLSAVSANFAQKNIGFSDDYQIFSSIYKNSYQKSQVIMREIEVQTNINNIVKYFSMFGDSKKNANHDNFRIFDDISLELSNLYANLGFWQSEASANYLTDGFSNPFFPGMDTISFREKILILSKLFKEGDTILGKENTARYLILFTDNEIIRPTGGKIVAFAVLNIRGGKLINYEVYSASHADSNLAGQVDPPQDLIRLIGNESWRFEDSNWASDFPTSALRSEWFLDKSLDMHFDGVIGIDKYAVTFLSEKMKKKNNSLNDRDQTNEKLLNDFLLQLSSIDKKKSISFVGAIIELLQNKHILFYSHNSNLNRLMADLNWNGNVKKAPCNPPCYSDLVGIVEASIMPGLSSVTREASLEISFEEKLIKRNLTFYIENNGDSDYETFIKILANTDSGFSLAKIFTPNEKDMLNPEVAGFLSYKEAGVKINIEPRTAKAVSISWESGVDDLSALEEYKLLVRSQPGMNNYSVSINLKLPENSAAGLAGSGALTDDGELRYNTNLYSDYIIQIPLK